MHQIGARMVRCNMAMHHIGALVMVRCNMGDMVRCNIGNMVRCNIAMMRRRGAEGERGAVSSH